MAKYFKYLLAHPKMATMSPEEASVLPQYTRHFVRDGVGVVPIKGGLSSDLFGFWGGLSYAQIQSTLEKFEHDPDIKGVILSIDSPGGDATGCVELCEYIKSFEKPVYSYVEGDACSAAYYIASATNRIISHRSGFVGSIGSLVSYYKPGANHGESKVITSEQSPFKAMDPWNEAGEKRIQMHLNRITENFILDVSAWRGVNSDKVRSDFGQGDIVHAAGALQVGMIDEIGNFKTALTQILTGEKSQSTAKDKPGLTTEGGTGKKQNKRKKNMPRKIKNGRVQNVMVFIDDTEVPDDATTVIDVTIETLEETFPEVVEAIRQGVRDEMAGEDAAIEDAVEDADLADEEEAAAVLSARKREISPVELTKKLLQIKKAKMESPETKKKLELALRGKDNPKVSTTVAKNGTDLVDKTVQQRNGAGTASSISRIRNQRKNKTVKK